MGSKHVVRLSVKSVRRLGLTVSEAYLILPERTDGKAEIRADSETGPLIRLLAYEEALEILVT